MTTNFSFLIIWTLMSWTVGYLAGRMLARRSTGQATQVCFTQKQWSDHESLVLRLQMLNTRLKRDNARLEQQLRSIQR